MSNAELINRIDELIQDKQSSESECLFNVCKLLRENKPSYDWVGFYFAEHSSKTLHLGPFSGEPTDHKIIPFGKGICGQVAESNQTFLVEDVQAQDNYIACSLNVKSEIVVPLFINDKNVGQIDIDSNQVDAFTNEDEELLSGINNIIGSFLKKNNVNLKSFWV